MTKSSSALLILVVLLVVLGLAMVFNTSSAEILDRSLDKDLHHALIKQALYIVLGAILAIGLRLLTIEQILKLSGYCLVGGTVFLVLVFVPGIGQQVNGAHRWLGIGSYSFQPSEFVKYILPAYFIQRILQRGEKEGPCPLFFPSL